MEESNEIQLTLTFPKPKFKLNDYLFYLNSETVCGKVTEIIFRHIGSKHLEFWNPRVPEHIFRRASGRWMYKLEGRTDYIPEIMLSKSKE